MQSVEIDVAEASRYWSVNGVRSCGIRDAQRGAKAAAVAAGHFREAGVGEEKEALWAARRFAQHLGGGDARDSVKALGSVEPVRGVGPKQGKLWLYDADLGTVHGRCTLIAGMARGTCWHVAFRPAPAASASTAPAASSSL